jgi:hypothetical protein
MGEIAKLVEGSKKGTGYLEPADAVFCSAAGPIIRHLCAPFIQQ